MMDRKYYIENVSRIYVEESLGRERGRHEVGEGKHNALWSTCGAACKEDGGCIFALQFWKLHLRALKVKNILITFGSFFKGDLLFEKLSVFIQLVDLLTIDEDSVYITESKDLFHIFNMQ